MVKRLVACLGRGLAPALVLSCLVMALLPVHGAAADTGETSPAAAPAFDWIRQFGSAGPDYVSQTAVDGGSVYVTAGIYGPARDQLLTSKYDAGGNEVWTRENATAVAAGPGGTYVCYSASLYDFSLCKLDANGNGVWTRSLVFGDFMYPAVDISVSSDGVYVRGAVWGNPDTTDGDYCGPYLAKYDFEGNQCWTTDPYPFYGTAFASGLCADSTGVYLSWDSFGDLGEDGFVRKYDADGNEVWLRPVGLQDDSGLGGTCGVSADDTGVYLVAKDFGTGEIFLRKYDADGNPVWTGCLIEHAVADDIVAGHLTVTACAGGIYVAGSTWGALSGQTNQGGSDAFVCKYDTDGNLLWTRQFGTSADDEATAISVADGVVYVGGSTGGTLPGCSSQGDGDAFLLRMTDSEMSPRITSWQLQESPLNWGRLRSVWGSSPSDVYATGDTGTILHYDGTAWTSMPSGTVSDLNGLWGSSPSDVYAVGGSGTVLHYDGAAWRAMASGTTAGITGIWGASWSSVFCVLSTGAVLHHDGLAWSSIYGGPGYRLNAVWGSSSSDVFAVGDGGGIVHFDGTSWTPMTSGTDACLKGVWGASPTDVYAAGSGGTVLHYDGGLWSPLALPVECQYGNRDVNAIWGSSSAIFFGGGIGFWRYDGGAWSRIDWSFGMDIEALWGNSSSDVFAVGWGITHYSGAGYAVMSARTGSSGLVSVWGSSPTDVRAIGNWGAQVHCDGSLWSMVSEGSDDGCVCHWHDIWGSSPSDVYIGGNWGCPETGDFNVWHYDGAGWKEECLGHMTGAASVWAIWGTSASDVFVVGGRHSSDWSSGRGVIFHFDGTEWSSAVEGTYGCLGDVWGSSTSDVFAIGDNGTILHYDGASWNLMDSGTCACLRSVWGTSPSDVFAAGDGGIILHYDGNEWAAMESGTSAALYGIWGSTPSDVLAVGSGGTALYYDGHEWSGMATGTTSCLNAIWGSAGSYVYAVGDGGTILRCADPGNLMIDTEPADGVTVSSARLNGDLTSLGGNWAAQVYFEWGLTAEYGHATPPATMTGRGPFAADLGGLLPGTTYHVRAVVQANGMAYGPDRTFVTPGQAPVVATSLASGVTPGEAVLNGSLTHLGSLTSVNVCFEWGPTPGYGQTTAPQELAGTRAFAANIAGLTPGTIYHFRARVEGDDTVYGDDMTFVSAAEPARPPADPTDNGTGTVPAPAGPGGDPASSGAPGNDASSGVPQVEDGRQGRGEVETAPPAADVSPESGAPSADGSTPEQTPARARVWLYPVAVMGALLGVAAAAAFASWLRGRMAA